VLPGVVVAMEAEADKQQDDEPPPVANNPCVALNDWSSAEEPMPLVDNHQSTTDTVPSAEEPMYASGDHLAAAKVGRWVYGISGYDPCGMNHAP
jgi:hypothetical protein